MKEKIERFAGGEFEYEQPSLQISADEIAIRVEAGKQYEGSFTIGNSAGRIMKGLLYSSNRLLTFNQTSFIGNEIIITYRFDATYLRPEDIIEGNIVIVSDCGEITLPFTAYLEAPAINTSIGKIKDLLEFANLARMDWTEAKKVFRSEDFERIILKNEEKYQVIYRNLLKSISTSQALEEFLIAVNKKTRINLCVDKTVLEYDVLNEDIFDKLIITKDHWGYAEIRVSTDAPFIMLEQKFLWADRFIGNNHNITFTIKAAKLKPGINYGRIFIKTVHQTITVEIICRNRKEQTKVDKPVGRLRFNYDFTRTYLDFRIGRIDKAKYLQEIGSLLSLIDESTYGTVIKLLKLHAAILSDDRNTAALLLEELSAQEAAIRKNSVFEYCAYLYLWALYRKDEDTISRVTDIIGRYYMRENFSWRILWFLLFTDKRYERNRYYKLADIKEQYDTGCRSPVLYYEALCVYNEEPYLLRELTDFEIQVMNFGIKNDCLTRDVAFQYIYLAGRLKYFNPVVFRGLTKLYKIYETEEILSTICGLLIKGCIRDKKYFEWFNKGVSAQLHITQLYEYFMYTVDENRMEVLPESLLYYFAYNNRLNDRQKAYLYANIIKNRQYIEHIYQMYYKSMESFVKEQLEARKIGPNLAIIYMEFINEPELKSYYEKYLPDVMFTKELYCDNPNIVSAVVVHKELDEAQTVHLSEGKANVQLYTTDAHIFLVDSLGNRYAVSIDYVLKPLLKPEDFTEFSMDYENHTGLLLYLFDYCRANRIVNEEAINLRKKALSIPGLKERYYIECLLTLIEYYNENYNADLLEYYLMKLDLSKVKESGRIKYLEYMVVRGYYNKALEALNYFGTEGIPVQRLLKLCSGWITYSGLETKEDLLLYLCYDIFTQGKYDEAILHYLVKYYNGSIRDMLNLWHVAKDFGMDTRDLEERLLAQILFTEEDMEDKYEVFLKYYRNVTNHMLVKAFLTYNAYGYLVHDRFIDDDIFPIIRRELYYEDNPITLLAWLKYNSCCTSLSDNDKAFISYHIDRLERQGVILPFFKKYKDLIKLPERILYRYYVDYRTDPKKQVFIHYRLKNSGNGFITERMPNVFLGIHVKEFMLFYNESFEYYITEESNDEVRETGYKLLCYEDEDKPRENTKYSRINMMLKALDKADKTALLEMMDEYVVSEYIINECYEPLP